MPPSETLNIRSFLHAMPKAELHLHLDGSARAQTLIEIARVENRSLPTHDPDELLALLHPGPQARSLRDYLRAFDITIPLMQSPESIARIARELVEDCAAENHHYVEVRYAPVFLTRGGLTMREAIHAVARGLGEGQQMYGVRSRQILCAMRHLDPDEGIPVIQLAAELGEEAEIGAVDLAGAEAEFPTRLHHETFRAAAEQGVPITIHAGEAAGPESVREAIDLLGARRIGHGTALRRDDQLRERVRREQITVEICPTSNVQTGAVEDMADHPGVEFLREGLNVAVCTDNRTVSHTTLTDEFAALVETHQVTLAELRTFTANAFASAFLPAEERDSLRTRALSEFDRLVRERGPWPS